MIIINDKEFNDLNYEEALKKVFEVRKQRQQIYGDSWKNAEYWEHLALIKEKVRRLEQNIIYKNNNYENEIDCLIDLINFSLFLLNNKIEKEGYK